LVLLYWSVGREILERQRAEGWGAKAIERLSHDLQLEFPGVEGYSPRNLKYMRTLAEVWPEPPRVPQLVALLPWDHLRVLLDQLKDPDLRADGFQNAFREPLGTVYWTAIGPAKLLAGI
jgi:hypothetical protein